MDPKPNTDIICKNIKKEPGFTMREIKKEPVFVDREIKKEPVFVVREIKKEPDFFAKEIKKEPDFVIRKIKNEPCQSGVEYGGPQLTERAPKNNKTKRKAKKRSSKNRKRSNQAKKTNSYKDNVISKESKRCVVKTKKKRKKKRKSAKSIKKEANTLLDQLENRDLRLFGIKDELEYFPSESNHKESEETNSGENIGKRTRLSCLNARDKVIHALKSAPPHSSSNLKPLIQQPKSENVDVLGSILENQALWHSKTSHMKVNEDGSVEVIDRKNKKVAKLESTNDKEINLLRNKENSVVSMQTRSGRLESLNLIENLDTHSMKMNIKVEACNTTKTWDMVKVFGENKEQIREEKDKIEEKKENNSSTPVTRTTFANSSKTEKSDDEVYEYPIFSGYSKASQRFSLEKDEEKETKFLSDKSEIEIIEIKEVQKIDGNNIFSKRRKNYEKEEKHRKLDTSERRGRSPSPKRRKQENQQRKNITLITLE